MKAPNTKGWVKLSDLKTPYRWFFRGTKRKRDVTVHLFVCYGAGTHTYADLNEEDDVVWDPRDKSWKNAQMEFEDAELGSVTLGFIAHKLSSGRRFHERFDRRVQAEKWVLKEAEKTFPKTTHRLVEHGYPYGPWKPKHIGKTAAQLATKCDKCGLAVRDRGTNATNDWTGGPYCDVCSSHLPPYGDQKARAIFEKVTREQARKWKKKEYVRG